MLTRRPLDGIGLSAAGLLLVAAYAGLLGWAMSTLTYSVWGGLIVVPWVIAFNVLLIWRAARHEGSTWFAWVLSLGYLAKLVGVGARYLVAYVVYNGGADAERYNQYAAANYRLWREGAFVWEWSGKQGTQYLELITTGVYTVIGPTPFGGFVVFGSMAFWGTYLLYRAFRIALPDADHRRYALLVFFLPSVLYWPASIGKESWLLLFLGVTALGAARYFTRQPRWLWLLVAGAVGLAMIRPHVAVLVFGALLLAQLFRPAGTHTLGALSKVAGLLVMAGVAAILVTQSAEFLGIDDLSTQAIADEIAWASGQTQQGGSAFTPVPLTDPLGVPAAIITLLFRPFPWEGGNFQMVAQGLEGLFLLGLTVAAFPRWAPLWRRLSRQPYLVFSLTYVVAFIVAFSQFGNFGIVSRQRVLMLPFFLVFLALQNTSSAPRRALPHAPREVAHGTPSRAH